MAEVKTATFNGERYLIAVGEYDGMCDVGKKERELVILANLDTRNGLITAIHEALHACDWSAREDKVDSVSKDIGRFLWRLGYRRSE